MKKRSPTLYSFGASIIFIGAIVLTNLFAPVPEHIVHLHWVVQTPPFVNLAPEGEK